MTSRRHHGAKSNGTGDVQSPYRSPISLSNSVSQSTFPSAKSLLSKFIKPDTHFKPRHHHMQSVVSPKSLRHPQFGLKVSKSISISLKEPNFEIDSSKELSSIRQETGRTPQVERAVRGFQSETSSAKNSPKVKNFGELHKEQFESQVLSLELMLSDQLKAVNKNSSFPTSFESQFPIYEKVFQEVIDYDRQFGTLLAKIKAFYELWLRSFSQDGKNQPHEQCNELLKIAKQKLRLCAEEKKFMLRRIKNLSKETVEMNQNIEDLEAEKEDLKGKLENIKSIDLMELPKSEEAWKYLIVENQQFYQENRRLRRKLKAAEMQTDTLQLLVQRMRDRGFPIEELEERLISSLESSKVEDLEPITSGPAKVMETPASIPKLRLNDVKGFDSEIATTEHQDVGKVLDSLAQLDALEFSKMVATRETATLEDV